MSNQFKNILLILVLAVLGQGCFLSAADVRQEQKKLAELILEGVSPALHPFCKQVYFSVRAVLCCFSKEIQHSNKVEIQKKDKQREAYNQKVAVAKTRVPFYLNDALAAVKSGKHRVYYEYVQAFFLYFEEIVVEPLECCDLLFSLLEFHEEALHEELFALCNELLFRVEASISVVAKMANDEEARLIENYAYMKEVELVGRLMRALKIALVEEAGLVELMQELSVSSDSFGMSSTVSSLLRVSPASSTSSTLSPVPKSPQSPLGNGSFVGKKKVSFAAMPTDSSKQPAILHKNPAKASLDPQAPGLLFHLYQLTRRASEVMQVGWDLCSGSVIRHLEIDLNEAFDA